MRTATEIADAALGCVLAFVGLTFLVAAVFGRS